MVLSLAVVGIVVVFLVAVTYRARPDPIHVIDPTSSVEAAQALAPFTVVVPVGLPTTWRPTSARYDPADTSPVPNAALWHVGYVTPAGAYASLDQAQGDPPGLLRTLVAGAHEVGPGSGRSPAGSGGSPAPGTGRPTSSPARSRPSSSTAPPAMPSWLPSRIPSFPTRLWPWTPRTPPSPTDRVLSPRRRPGRRFGRGRLPRRGVSRARAPSSQRWQTAASCSPRSHSASDSSSVAPPASSRRTTSTSSSRACSYAAVVVCGTSSAVVAHAAPRLATGAAVGRGGSSSAAGARRTRSGRRSATSAGSRTTAPSARWTTA